MPITPREFPAIVADLRDKVSSSLPELDTSEATFFRLATIDPMSLELQELETLLLTVQQSQSLLTATGDDLDLLAFNYNVQRRGAQKASGFVQIYAVQQGFSTAISIPKGTSIYSSSGLLYTTLLDGVLNGFAQQSTRNGVAVYEITLPATASIDGSSGNAIAGTLVSIAIPNLSVTNDAAIEGGYDQESDDSLAQRAILSFGIWSRGVKSAVEAGARLVPGVYSASAVYAYAGHFNLYVADQAGNLSDEMKAAVDTILVDWAAEGIGWTILAPPLFLINVAVSVAFKSSINANTQINQLKTDIATVINATTTNTLYKDDFDAAIRAATLSYVAHFSVTTPASHIIQPIGTILRSGTIVVTDVTGTI